MQSRKHKFHKKILMGQKNTSFLHDQQGKTLIAMLQQACVTYNVHLHCSPDTENSSL